MNSSRGCLILFEGLDRAGKTTQSKKLEENLKSIKFKTKLIRFPNRQSEISGQVINNYLQQKKELNNQVAHLIFSGMYQFN